MQYKAKNPYGKHLKKTARGVVLPSGEIITYKRLAKYRNKVKAANAAIKRQAAKTPKRELEKMNIFGQQSSFLNRHKTARLNGIMNKTQFMSKYKAVAKITTYHYFNKREQQYKTNFIKGMRKVFEGRPELKDLIRKIQAIDAGIFAQDAETERLPNLGFFYSKIFDLSDRLAKIEEYIASKQ